MRTYGLTLSRMTLLLGVVAGLLGSTVPAASAGILDGLALYSSMDNSDVNRAGTNPPPALTTNDGAWTVENTQDPTRNGTASEASGTTGYVQSSATGQINEATDFVRAGDNNGNTLVDYGDNFNHQANQGYTVSFWFRPDLVTINVLEMVVCKGNTGSADAGWSVFFKKYDNGKEGTLFLRGNAEGDLAGLQRADTIVSGNWYHVALVIDDTVDSVVGYVNGLGSGTSGTGNGWAVGGGGPSDNTFTDGNTFASSDPFRLGASASGNAEYDGMIDDLAIWNRALSADEILTIYADGLEGIGVVPEPSTLVLLFSLGLAGLFVRRRHVNYR